METQGLERLKLADERISANTADGEEAALLGIGVGFPLFVAQRLVYDVQDAVVEICHSLIRADH
jgi:DNA-binding GntR family transcriptional regulator